VIDSEFRCSACVSSLVSSVGIHYTALATAFCAAGRCTWKLLCVSTAVSYCRNGSACSNALAFAVQLLVEQRLVLNAWAAVRQFLQCIVCTALKLQHAAVMCATQLTSASS
jgi:hypothetical protein